IAIQWRGKLNFSTAPKGHARGSRHQPQGGPPEPAKRTGGAISFSRASVIDPFQEPLVAGPVVVQLAQQAAVEHRLPVLADDRLLPPLRLDLPPRDGVERSAERPRDEDRRATVIKGYVDRG